MSTLKNTTDGLIEGKKQKAKRKDKGEGSLFKRGRFWTFNAPNEQQYPTGKTINAEAIQFKHDKMQALAIRSSNSTRNASAVDDATVRLAVKTSNAWFCSARYACDSKTFTRTRKAMAAWPAF